MTPNGCVAALASEAQRRRAGCCWGGGCQRTCDCIRLEIDLFVFSGEACLSALGLSSFSLQLAGGVVVFLIAIRMIFPPTGGS